MTLNPYSALQTNFLSGMIAYQTPITSVQKLADGFMDFFMEKIDKIMVNLIPNHLNQMDAKYIENNLLTNRQFNTFRTVTEEDVKVTITNAPPKHCQLDPIPSSLLR